jgi:hypothetical protein
VRKGANGAVSFAPFALGDYQLMQVFGTQPSTLSPP